uniref:Uncharacterized protein n=1 Tax=Tanacetum cinerariifolium TaxID=118510 RepID=A0A699HCR1_TANCI|nr:hypothetical protein [Tanacetum cinerariifolium]
MGEMLKEWMARQTEANERMKEKVVELENQINQGLRNRQAIIKNLERQIKYLKEIQPTKSLSPNAKPRHEFVYKPPSTRNENVKDCTMYILYSNVKMFVNGVLSNHVGDKELNSTDDVGNRALTKKNKEKNDMGMPKEHKKE